MDETEIVQLAQRGDERALTELYHRYSPAALKTAFLLTGSRATAEDVLQDTFIQVIRKIHTLRDPERFRPWFFRILTHSADTARRKGFWRRWLTLDLENHDKPDPGAATVSDQVIAFDEAREVREAVERLRPAHRTPLVLHYFNGLSEAEVAEILGCAAGTVKSRLYRARQQLHHLLTAGGGSATQLLPAVRKE